VAVDVVRTALSVIPVAITATKELQLPQQWANMKFNGENKMS